MRSVIANIAVAIDRALKIALIVLLSAIVLSIAWQVLSRYLLRDPSSWTEELARFALIWAGFLGAVFAYRTHAHVGIDFLKGTLSQTGRRTLEAISACCVIAFSLPVIAVGGTNLVLTTAELEQRSAALGLQMAWVYAVIPISGALLVVYACNNILNPPIDLTPAEQGAD